MFPVEPEKWNCDDTGNYVYSQPFPGRASAMTYLSNDEGIHNPFASEGFHGTCSFPQISNEGLSDAWQHGRDIHGVYHDMFPFMPHQLDKERTLFRVTNHAVTSQTAGAFVKGLYMLQSDVPVSVQVCFR
jgi:2-phosphoxylose phosphatase